MTPKKVAIVGAGPCGLPAIRHALLYGLQPVCFESGTKVGGLWNYKDQASDETSVMYSTVMNSSKEMSSFSDFPPRDEEPNFMHHSQLLQYFSDYADNYDLRKYIKFNHKVLNIAKSDNFSESGQWVVEYHDSTGNHNKELFDGVMVAIGHHHYPNMSATWPGQNEFKGNVIHAQKYKHSAGYENKRVVVVGIGNSGVDIAVELSRVAKKAFLSTRRGSWISSRTYDYGLPADTTLNTRFLRYTVMKYVPKPLRAMAYEKKLNMRFDHELYGLRPTHDVFGAHLTTNDELPSRLVSGNIIIKPNIRRFTENDVIFEDGTIIKNVDDVILATGYEFKFPIVENGELIKVHNNQVNLYKFMFPLDLEKNTLAILGCVQPLGCIWTIAEMQARVFCAQLTGSISLPTSIEMKKDVEEKREEMMNTFYGSKRHTIQVNYIEFMDELSIILRCCPTFWNLIFKDPSLAMKITFGPCAPYVYRIAGPHPWTGARKAIMNLQNRVICGLHPNRKNYKNTDSLVDYSMLFIVILVAFILFYMS